MLSNLKYSFWSAFQLQCTGARPFISWFKSKWNTMADPIYPSLSVLLHDEPEDLLARPDKRKEQMTRLWKKPGRRTISVLDFRSNACDKMNQAWLQGNLYFELIKWHFPGRMCLLCFITKFLYVSFLSDKFAHSSFLPNEVQMNIWWFRNIHKQYVKG